MKLIKKEEEKKLISHSDRIFIAGSNGMAGRAIYKSLNNAGYGNESVGGKLLTPGRDELDLTNIEDVKRWYKLNKPNVVILAAAKVGGIYANSSYPTDFILENLKIEINTIETSFKNNIKRFLFLGSSCIYPKKAPQPIQEESLLTNSLEVTNEYYAIAKIAGIKLCQALRAQHGFDAISLMPTNLYGPGDNYHPLDSHVVASLIRKFAEAKKKSLKEVICWGTGNPLREFLHSDDLGDACRFTLEKWNPDHVNAPLDLEGNPLTILNVGTGLDIKISHLAKLIAEKLQYKGEIVWDTSKPDGTPKKQLDVSKINELGWHSKITLEEGLNSTIDEYLSFEQTS